MKSILISFVVACSLLPALFRAHSAEPSDPASATIAKVGDVAPSFEVTTLDGKKFSLEEQKGKVVVVNFFATWCGPCLAELPHVESDLWQKYKDRKFALIVLGREHSNDELKPFLEKHKFTFPMAGDVKRNVFSQYASAYIPRTVLIDPKGKIVAHSIGYNETEFKAFLARLDEELAKLK